MSLEESYRTLRVKPGASFAEVRRSYLQLVKLLHPDRHQGSPGLLRKATEETKKLNLAYERICRILRGSRQSAPHRPTPSQSPRPPRPSPPPVFGQAHVAGVCGLKLNWIAPGRFTMGSPAIEAGRSEDEGPQTEVTITRGFWLAVFPVTQEEWSAVAEGVAQLNREPSFFRGDRLPVEQVSWTDCQKWLRELNRVEGEANRLPPGYAYRLPTEAEWEFACRAGTRTAFVSGEAPGSVDDYAWYSANSSGKSQPVGSKSANGWGLHDMHGNVWEWCADRYGGPLPGGSVVDPVGPMLGLNRVMRGGSWGVAAHRCRAAYRVWNAPAYRDYTVGFRAALAAVEA